MYTHDIITPTRHKKSLQDTRSSLQAEDYLLRDVDWKNPHSLWADVVVCLQAVFTGATSALVFFWAC
jgi:hypothetical protein